MLFDSDEGAGEAVLQGLENCVRINEQAPQLFGGINEVPAAPGTSSNFLPGANISPEGFTFNAMPPAMDLTGGAAAVSSFFQGLGAFFLAPIAPVIPGMEGVQNLAKGV